jgi:hypothetical protein
MLDSDLPGMPGRYEAIDGRSDGDLSERLKLAIA